MVTAAEMKIIADRWKRATKPLKVQDQEYGLRLVAMLKEYNEEEIKRFDDPFEAAACVLMIGLLTEQDMV